MQYNANVIIEECCKNTLLIHEAWRHIIDLITALHENAPELDVKATRKSLQECLENLFEEFKCGTIPKSSENDNDKITFFTQTTFIDHALECK